MKARSGFVSNSSSSSFIVGAIRDPLLMKAMQATEQSNNLSIKEIAQEMLKASDRNEHTKWLDRIPDNVKFICFKSCNYETEIMALDGCATILTCNNESGEWQQAFDIIIDKYDVLVRYIEDTEIWDDLVRGSSYYKYSDYMFSELGETYEASLHYSLEKIAREYGPAVYINGEGVVIYEGEKRICIK